MQIRKSLIVETLLIHKICVKYSVVFSKTFQQNLSKFWDMLCCATACSTLIKNYTIACAK